MEQVHATSKKPKLSILEAFSYGIAAENIGLKTLMLEVTPVEHLSLIDGELNADQNDYKGTGKDTKGNDIGTTIKTSNTLSAQWLCIGSSNRITPPTIRRGEQLIIYKAGDTNKYFWTTLNSDIKLRKLELAVYAWSATPDENETTAHDTTYFFEVNAMEKTVSFHTSQANGEFCGYDIQIDTGNGRLFMKDTIGNSVLMDSKEHQVRIENTEGNYFDLIKNVLNISVADEINSTTKAYKITCDTYELDASQSITTNTQTLTSTNSDATITSSGSNTIESSGKNTIDSPSNTISGAQTMLDTQLTAGGGSHGGAASIKCDIEFAKAVTSNGVNISDSHIHSNGNQGHPTGSVIG